ncbi:MAG TPA: cation:proton antiporter, partial [Longimicrobiales bacterium]|nr:cation:proton antiporter [Longimicrobiales bacterium]
MSTENRDSSSGNGAGEGDAARAEERARTEEHAHTEELAHTEEHPPVPHPHGPEAASIADAPSQVRWRLLALILLGSLALLLRSRVEGPAVEALRPAATTLALGFLLLAAVVAGGLAARVRLPRITGYLLLGFVAGPPVLGLITSNDVASLRLIDDIAISLIALSAGAELRLRDLRERGRTMISVLGFEMTTVFVMVGGTVLLLAPLLPFTAGRPLGVVATIALIFGSIAIANSPSVAIAVINDTRSRGPVSSTILGVTVLKDVVVILLFAVALSFARSALSPEEGFDLGFLWDLTLEIGGSIVVGALSGLFISLYLRHVKQHLVLFALSLAFLNAWLASVLHLEVLLLSLAAGFFLENIAPERADPFVEAVELNSLPLYALFFSLAGASLHMDELARLWPFVLLLVGVRAVAVFAGTWVGARVAGAEPEVRRYAWLGFISQAGVTLGMVVIAARAFPTWGEELRTLFVAMVAIHELVGPVLLQYGLGRAGETG